MFKKINYIFSMIMFFVTFLISYSTKWLITTFGLLSVDELIFHLKVPLKGTGNEMILNFIKNSLIPSLFLTLLIFIIFVILKNPLNVKIIANIRILHRNFKFKVFPCYSILKYFWIISIIIFEIVVNNCSNKIGLDEYLKSQAINSNFVIDNYVDPQKVKLTFPSKKRNLIYIFVESLESTFFSKDLGGDWEVNLLPNLYKLSKENISFSNIDKMGGSVSTTGTGWTIGAMVAQTSGLPLLIPIEGNSYSKYNKFLPGACSIGEILSNAGYKNYLLIGSDATFGGRRDYFLQHGNYEIYDYITAKENGDIDQDYYVWWGYEDKKLYNIAKRNLLSLAKNEEPFNFTMLTVDTHHIDGYLDETCKTPYSDKFSNVIACTDQMLYEFITWIQKQEFYQNTTIVISGDHLSMNYQSFVDKQDYVRTNYNLFVNSVVNTNNTNNRLFSTIDMFPSTLASLGVVIEGDRLGLGTNLFSSEMTLKEKYGNDIVNTELQKRSKFYNNVILYGD